MIPTIPQPFPYQGSKRRLAGAILAGVPRGGRRLIEPFAGSAAVSLAAAATGKAGRFLINDRDRPLAGLWRAILDDPSALADAYKRLWHDQHGRERAFYDEVRARFNAAREPVDLLYLLARCAKAAVRYNARGAFNNSPDNRRRGTRPAAMRANLLRSSALLAGRAEVRSDDYRDVLARATPGDLVYLDPPYQGVSRARDRRYLARVDRESYLACLRDLVARGVPFIASDDGRTGSRAHGAPLPDDLGLVRLELPAGRSSQATLLGRAEVTYESLYLSPGWPRDAASAAVSPRDRARLGPRSVRLLPVPAET